VVDNIRCTGAQRRGNSTWATNHGCYLAQSHTQEHRREICQDTL